MTVIGQIKQGAYFDSVTLMRVGGDLARLPGVVDTAVVLGHGSNAAPAAELGGVLRQALRKAGAIVMPSNAPACNLAGQIIQCRRGSR